jgi:penicillin G amidase
MKKKYTIFFLYLLLSVLVLIFMGISWDVKGNRLPPPGKFFSPFHGFWQNAELPAEFKDLELKTGALSGPVEIAFDDRLLPYIFAENEYDAAYAQGYLHARYRLWQVDVALRDITGNLSEVFGERTLKRDLQTRREGFTWAVEQNLKVYMQDTAFVNICQSYMNGFNDFVGKLDYREYPLEFKMLDYAPSKLEMPDLIALTKNLARTLTTKQYDQANHQLFNQLGADLFDQLFPLFFNEQSPVHPSSDSSNNIGERLMEGVYSEDLSTSFFLQDEPMEEERGFASNNWAVGPEKTASGAPILCNDPHLKLTLPSIWYETAIITPQYKTHGVSMPGLPMIIIGFNEHIAWGITNGGQDVLDMIAIKWLDDSKLRYKYDQDTLEVSLRIEKIKIKGRETIVDTVKYTRWGPVVSSGQDSTIDLAMHWTAHYAISPDEIMTFTELNKARNLDDYLKALGSFPSPLQNVVFASVQGDIALKTVGHWPIRKNHSGLFVADGSDPESSWNSLLGFDELPLTINPDRKYVSSANQHSTNADFPQIYFGYYEGFRGRILNRYLEEGSGMTMNDMINMQLSTYSLKAEEALGPMIELIPKDLLNKEQQAALNQLKLWDMRFEPEKWEPVLFDAWYTEMEKVTFDEVLILEEAEFSRKPEKWVLSRMLDKNTDHLIFDDQSTPDVKETVSDMLLRSFLTAWEESGISEGSSNTNWNSYQRPQVSHLAQIPAFSVMTKVGGHPDVLNAVSRENGPSWRMIVEMQKDGPIAKGVYPGGQSGNPGSKYYADMIEAWSNGTYYDLDLPVDASAIKQKLFTVTLR